MVKIKFLPFALAICVLAACSPSPQTIQTAIAQTQAALPTLTPTATTTQTATPTATTTQTATPTTTIVTTNATNVTVGSNSKPPSPTTTIVTMNATNVTVGSVVITNLPTVSPGVVQYSNGSCHSVNWEPDLNCTPGVANPNVTQENIYSTICVSGYTTTIRPSTSYTNKLKSGQIIEYGYTDTNLSDYEEDHFIPLEVGGDPTNPKNLWPELGSSPNPKDSIENLCHKEVCSGQISLAEAQREIVTNWHIACGGNITITPSVIIPVIVSTPSPTNTNTQSNGATALCNDGTYSYTAHHQGACSHHGGVAQFYK